MTKLGGVWAVLIALLLPCSTFAVDSDKGRCTIDNKGRFFLLIFQHNYDSTPYTVYAASFTDSSANFTSSNGVNKNRSILRNTTRLVSVVADASLILDSSSISTKYMLVRTQEDVAVLSTYYESYGGAAGGYLALPSHVLSNEYIVVTSADHPVYRGNWFYVAVAALSQADVTIKLRMTQGTVTYNGMTYSNMDTLHLVLGKYQALQLQSKGDLTGTLVRSSSPVVVTSGAKCAFIVATDYCDSIVTQLVPTNKWDRQFIIPPLPERKVYLVRIVSRENSNRITIFNTTKQYSILLDATDVRELILGTGVLVVSAEKPISIHQLSPSHIQENVGDPAMLLVPAIKQYSSNYVAPKSASGSTYVSVIIEKSQRQGLLIKGATTNSSHSVPAPYDNYTVVLAKVEKSGATFQHTSPKIKFGSILYSLHPYAAYGFPLGIEFGNKCIAGAPCNLQDVCPENANCINGSCQCNQGYKTENSTGNCKDINECDHVSLCNTLNGDCNNTPGSFSCACHSGWTGQNCDKDINECLAIPCGPNAVCINLNGTYNCSCPYGYHGDPYSGCNNTMTDLSPANCFSCNDMQHLRYCDVVRSCSIGQVCYIEEYEVHGTIYYRSGCADKQVCNIGQLRTDKRRRNVLERVMCTECCHGDYCNKEGCGDDAFPSTNVRGPICYECEYLNDPAACHHVTHCPKDEVCSIEKIAWDLGDYQYKMGCKHNLHCSDLAGGKRSTTSCLHCCTSDFCNRNCTERYGPQIIG